MMSRKKIKDTKKEALFSELHTLLVSGLDFSRAFQLLTESEGDASVRILLKQLYASVVRGASLGESFSASSCFHVLDCGVLKIGEETGQIADSLHFLAEYYRRRIEQGRMISGAVSYPLIILVVAVVVLVFMLTVVVPMFEQVYSRMGGELPWLTSRMIVLADHFPAFLMVSGVVLSVGSGIFYHYRHRDSMRAMWADVLLKLPGVGSSIRKSQQARFCQLLCLLHRSGVPLLRSLDLLREIMTFYPYQQSFPLICEGLRRGALFTEMLSRFPQIYDHRLCALLRVGEETNHLGEMLQRQGEELNRELEHRLKQLGNFLEPVLILGVGGLVALILIAMYMPMFKLGGIME